MVEPLHPDTLTWAALLARWVEFARSAVALPDTAEGNALRDSVPDIIQLQAVWFALQHLDELDADQRALGLDRAEVLIEKHADALCRRWGESLPDMVRELIDDAHAQLRQSELAGRGGKPEGRDPLQ